MFLISIPIYINILNENNKSNKKDLRNQRAELNKK